MTRRHVNRAGVFASALVIALGVASAAVPAGAARASVPDPDVGTLPAAARKIMERPPYDTARWVYFVADRKSGKVLLASRADEMVFTGSTAKNFTVASAYETLGIDTRLKTPVVATAPVTTGTIAGDLVLVASGDLALGGRGAIDGKFEHTFNADTVDHVYADIAPNATTIGEPLAGLDSLARQVAANGVTRVDGDVVIDTRVWDDFAGSEGPIPPIFVNDNFIDIQVTAASEGQPATLEVRPSSSAFTVRSEVETVGRNGDTMLAAEASESDPRVIVVNGSIASGHTQLTTYRIPDPATWARTLFVEALGRAGVTVAAPTLGPNDEASLPPAATLAAAAPLASIESPTIGAMGRMIVETSYNAGANAFLCLVAVHEGSTDCTDGLQTMNDLVKQAGLDPAAVFLVDGQGADPASTTPRQIAKWMAWARTRPWGKAFLRDQPVLGETGSLAPYGGKSPAKGKVLAKVGTSVAVNPTTGRLYSKVQSLAGYLVTHDGRELVFGLSMNGGTYPQLYQGLVDAGADVANVAAAFQQSLSK